MNNLLPKTLSQKIALLLLPFVIAGVLYVVKGKVDSANATENHYGGLIVETGVPHDGPLFTNFDFKPGDCDERTIKVQNTTNSKKSLTVRSLNVEETGNLSEALTMEISQNENVLYSESLEKFFDDSQSLDGVVLDEINAGQTKFYKFKICFNIEAGNEYQKKTVEFDLKFGDKISPIELPEECSHLRGTITTVINGKTGNDRIDGTSASELILGNGGNDRIDGGAGHDCIVTLDGKDRIDGGAGHDVIVSGGGDDRVEGGSGDDRIYAGSGKDRIDGGSGDDLIYGGDGNDDINGDSGHDEIYGESGDDKINGDTGNDYLNGGPGKDKLNGGTGTDECVLGEQLSNCEI